MSELFPTLDALRADVRADLVPVADAPDKAWAIAAHRGWLTRNVPDSIASSGPALHELAVVCEEAGATGVGAPILRRIFALLTLTELAEFGPARDVASGALDLAVVSAVADSRDPLDTRVDAAPSGRAWMVNGRAAHVPGGVTADELLIVLRSRPFAGRERGLRVYRGPVHGDGITVTPRPTLDDPSVAMIDLRAAAIGDERSVGPSRDAWPAFERVLDRMSVLVAAEMVGAARVAVSLAADWVTTREQWGAPLFAKQAVQHRLADMHIALVGVADSVQAALDLDTDRVAFAEAATIAKLAASTLLPTVTASAHQLHGGEGYYADRSLHQRHRRVVGLAAQFGGPPALRARLAELSGWGPSA
jgi:alkylation response protein AidB-like acyl-CoA dehydrogenase